MFVVWCLKDCRFCMKSYDVGFKLKQQVKVFDMIICVQFGGVFEDHYKLFFWLIDLFMFGFIYMIVVSGYYKFEYILVNGWIKKKLVGIQSCTLIKLKRFWEELIKELETCFGSWQMILVDRWCSVCALFDGVRKFFVFSLIVFRLICMFFAV